MHPLRALRRTALLVGDVVRGALALPPVDDSLDDPAEGLGRVVVRVVGDALGHRVEARREQQWASALERLLAESGEDEAHAVAGAHEAVVAVVAVVGTEG